MENRTTDRIKLINIADEMKKSFISYSMSVIVSRALPDVRDGLKPVHRRILYSMYDLGITSDKSYKKSARIVGDVLGKYHPHGDSSVYDAMVRMSQDFSFRYMLVDGHGNFGSIDGDGAAAMRYTEARMSKLSMEMLREIRKETVDFEPNYSEEELEPTVMPARFPNLLVNGASGIAVGMATNIPPHNLGEVINGLLAYIDDKDITVMELMEDYIHGPDFPTGSYILGRAGIKSAYETGRGSVVMRAKIATEPMSGDKNRLVVTEIPYQVNKARLVEKIASLVRDKEIEGITDLRDESSREGMRIVIELRRDVQPEVILNQLYRMTALQSTFGVNMLALVNREPRLMGLKEVLEHYLNHQIEIIRRRTQFDLTRAEARAHILEGLLIALDNIDEIIRIIRASKNDAEITEKFINKFGLTEIQCKAILDMALRRLSGLEREKIQSEFDELQVIITDLKDILANHDRVLNIIREELTEIKDKYSDDRRSEIIEADIDMQDEDLIPVEDIVVALTANGYIKRTSVESFNVQNRGGRGVKGMSTYEEDYVDQFVAMSTHDYIMCFTNTGRVFRMRGFNVPSASRTARGIPVVNLLNLSENESIRTIMRVKKEDDDSKYVFFVTKNGIVKRVELSEFDSIRQTGKIAITLKDEDELIAVRQTTGDDEIFIGGKNGKAIRFHEEEVRVMGRSASGVRGFNVDGSEVVGVATDREGKFILAITENGYGKRTNVEDYRLTKRGAKGVITINITERNGDLVSLRVVDGSEEILIITTDGTVIRFNVNDVGIYGRNAMGVKLINVRDDIKVTSVALFKDTVVEDESEDSEKTAEDENIVEAEITE
ncbi:MAG: DNA gyrase subunit A [Erysipelothrix sp.]|nr:DNA gyrase subunit A [Erysipelothrix sp.]